MAVRIYIVEDEPLIVATIALVLKKGGYVVLGDADNSVSAIRDVKAFRPDLVLIDIHLDKEESGIEVAQELDALHIPYFYLTSQTDPATLLKVKKTTPLGYIVKPFTEAGLRSSIEIGWSSYCKNHPDYLLFTSGGIKHRVNQREILYLKAFDNYCYIYTEKAHYLVPKTLRYLSEKLNAERFHKTHRSYFVNISHISAIGGTSIYLGETELPLARNFKAALLEKLPQ